jgi:hypothetical protein
MKRVSVDASVTDLICQSTLPDIVLNWADLRAPKGHFRSYIS